MRKSIVLLPGDGIGPEVTRAAATVLRDCAQEFNHQFDFVELPVGGAAIDRAGEAARLIFTNKIAVNKLISHRYSLEEMDRALQLASHPIGDSLKVVIHP